MSSSLTVSSAKGQFADVTISVQEGVQGPYKLRGPNGERFIIVMANSERIYLDGQLLNRGFNEDYVIDYNLGEITFNPNVLITQFSRARATYEYSDRNYNRSIINTHHQFNFGKTKISLNHYQEKDSKNNPLSFDLSDDDKLTMSLAGEQNLPVPISGEIQSVFDENFILYEKKDTLDASGLGHQVFTFSRDSSAVLFRVSFTEVPFGTGDYILKSTTANGRIYEWTSPENGQKQGNYVAQNFVPAPSKKQMTTLGAEVAVTKYSTAYLEMALSNHDMNLYSDLDSEDDQGGAMKIGFETGDKPIEFLKGYKFSSIIDFEHDGKNFKSIDRFRYIEYDRDWSFDPNSETELFEDNIFNLAGSLEKDRNNKLSYSLSKQSRGAVINGTRHEIVLNKKLNSVQVTTTAHSLVNYKNDKISKWKKFSSEIALDKYALVPGYKFELDENQFTDSANDSIVSTAMHFQSHQVYIHSNDTLNAKFRLEHTQRKDKRPVGGVLSDYTLSNTTRLNFDSEVGKNNHLSAFLTYRTLEYMESFSSNPKEETVLGKVQWNGSLLDGHIRSDFSYVTSSSREIRREFVYLPVVSGEGTHTWRDLNEDGIQDISEFFEAINFDERNYIRVFVPTDEYISAFNNQFNFNFHGTMPKTWKGREGLTGFLGKFSNRSSVTINKKSTDDSFASRFNPFQLHIADGDLIFARDAIRSRIFFNASNPAFGFDVGYYSSRSKQFITSGIDTRDKAEWSTNLRKQLSAEWSMVWNVTSEKKQSLSDYMDDRNFEVYSYSFSPRLVWQPSKYFRLAGEGEYKKRSNGQDEVVNEFSKITSFLMNARWNRALKNSMDVSFKYSDIIFDGEENTPLGYELLEALRPGSNFTWNLSYRQKLSNGLQLSLSYDGRKSPNQGVIHLGRMQVSALF